MQREGFVVWRRKCSHVRLIGPTGNYVTVPAKQALTCPMAPLQTLPGKAEASSTSDWIGLNDEAALRGGLGRLSGVVTTGRDIVKAKAPSVSVGTALLFYLAFCLLTLPASFHPLASGPVFLFGDRMYWPAWALFGVSVALWTFGAHALPERFVRWVPLLVVLLAVISLAVGWPDISADPREYILLAHAQFLGLNPLFAPYGSIRAMQLFPPMRRAGYPDLLDPYGPAFWALDRFLGYLPWQAALWVWRAAMAGLYVLTGRVLLSLAPTRWRLFLMAYVSPFAALSLAGVGHNVMLVIACLVAALWVIRFVRAPLVTALLGGVLLGLAPAVSLLGASSALALLTVLYVRRGRTVGVLAGALALFVFEGGYVVYGGTVLTALHNWISAMGQASQVFLGLGSAFAAFPGGHLGGELTKLVAAGAGFALVALCLFAAPKALRAGDDRKLGLALSLAALLPMALVNSNMPWYPLTGLIFAALFGSEGAIWVWLPFEATYGGALLANLMKPTTVHYGDITWILLGAMAMTLLELARRNVCADGGLSLCPGRPDPRHAHPDALTRHPFANPVWKE